MNRCPERPALERLLGEQFEGPERAAVEAHVEGCPGCQEALAALAGVEPGGPALSPPGTSRAPGDDPSTDFLHHLKRLGPPAPEAPVAVGAGDPPRTPTGAAEGAAAPPDGPPSVPGYEVLREVGRGGMGVVYEARHLALNRRVALKVIRPDGRAEPGERARFRREAEALARLQHPNVVQIHEVGEQGGWLYLALEFVAGDSLARQLQGAPLAPRRAAGLLGALCRAVQHAHDQGVVHRHLKPANVLLAADGTPKVTDFGLAKQVGGGPEQTQSGVILGTPSYMAPEQARGRRDVGPPADDEGVGGGHGPAAL